MKVLIGVPTYSGHSFCRLEFINKLKKIKERNGADIFVVWNGERDEKTKAFDEYKEIGKLRRILNTVGERNISLLAKKQNIIRKEFLDGGYTHLLMLESDNIPPDDVIDKLSSHNAQVVSGLYFINSSQSIAKPPPEVIKQEALEKGLPKFDMVFVIKQMPIPSVWSIFGCEIFEHSLDKTTDAVRLWSIEDYIRFQMEGKRLVPIFSSGVGCVLFDRDSISKIPFSDKLDMEGQDKQLTDFIWFYSAFKHGIECYVDIECLVSHKHFSGVSSLADVGKWFDPHTLQKI